MIATVVIAVRDTERPPKLPDNTWCKPAETAPRIMFEGDNIDSIGSNIIILLCIYSAIFNFISLYQLI